MPPTISKIVQALEPSATLAMAAKAREVKAAGRPVFDFSVGEPDFTTPEHICQAAVAAMKAGHTHYTQASGIPELRSAIAKQYEQTHRLKYSPQQVVVSNGAKHSLQAAGRRGWCARTSAGVMRGLYRMQAAHDGPCYALLPRSSTGAAPTTYRGGRRTVNTLP